MPHRTQRQPPAADQPSEFLLAGLGALKIATWEAHGPNGKWRARLQPAGCPEELQACAGRELSWIRLVFRSDRRLVITWLGQLTPRASAPEPLEYRVELQPGRPIWIRHWAQVAPPSPANPRSRGKPGKLCGLVQFIDDQKQFEAGIIRAREEERFALGQELHDNTCQILAGLSCLAQGFARSQLKPADRLQSLLDDLNRQLLAELERVRARAHDLVPAPAVRRGLAETLQILARQSQILYGVKIVLRLPSRLFRHDEVHVEQLHGIVRESIVNAIKHGQATMVRITLRHAGTGHVLEIRDNGRGFSSAEPSSGIGLHLMRHRAALLGATMTIENCPPTGARVRLNYSMA